MARILLERERKVLERLRGLPAVPELRDAWAGGFACSFLPGEALTRERFQDDPRGLAGQLRALVAGLHARRVYHLDLRQRQNLLVAPGGVLCLVDFGAALSLGPILGWCLGPFLAWVDRQAALKYLARYAPELLSAAEARAVIRGAWLRRLWIFSRHRSRGEAAAARRRLRELGAAPGPGR